MTSSSDTLSKTLFATFSKIDAEKRLVFGIATTERIDEQAGTWQGTPYVGDSITREAVVAALPDYMAWGNVREMHTTSAVGSAVNAQWIDDGEVSGLEFAAKVVDDQAWRKVSSAPPVYKGFSIGGAIVAAEIAYTDDGVPYRKVTAIKLTEISLVDRPANPDARILVWKGDNMPSEEQATTEQAVEQAAKVEAPVAETVKVEATEQASQAPATEAPVAKAEGEPVVFTPEQIAAIEQIAAKRIAKGLDDDIDELLTVRSIVGQLQWLRNKEELEGDGSSASMYSAAVALLLQIISADQVNDQSIPVAMADKTGDLAKAGKQFSAKNASAMHNVIKALASALAGAGDGVAGKIMAVYKDADGGDASDDASGDSGGDVGGDSSDSIGDGGSSDDLVAAEKTGDLAKTEQAAKVDASAETIAKLNGQIAELQKDIAALKAQPESGGPVLRVVAAEKVLAGEGLAKDSPAEAQAKKTVAEEIARLSKKQAETFDPFEKARIGEELAKLQIKSGFNFVN